MDDHEKEQIGWLAGLGSGMLAGAKIGGAVLPIPVVGTFAGAVVGAAAGSEVGKLVGKAAINGATAFVGTITGSINEKTPAKDGIADYA